MKYKIINSIRKNNKSHVNIVVNIDVLGEIWLKSEVINRDAIFYSRLRKLNDMWKNIYLCYHNALRRTALYWIEQSARLINKIEIVSVIEPFNIIVKGFKAKTFSWHTTNLQIYYDIQKILCGYNPNKNTNYRLALSNHYFLGHSVAIHNYANNIVWNYWT